MNLLCVALTSGALVVPLAAQGSARARPDGAGAPSTSLALPANYVIGPQDVLSVVFISAPEGTNPPPRPTNFEKPARGSYLLVLKRQGKDEVRKAESAAIPFAPPGVKKK